MSEWLRAHVYLATWLSLLVATTGLVIRNVRASASEVDWRRAMIYIVLLTSLAAALTPSLDYQARFLGGSLVFFTLGWIMMGKH
jgi:ABC-type transport system involved in cytochrome c biogenesis permease subunit